jgi:hypothetical protein
MEPPSEHCRELRENLALHRSLTLLSMGTARRRRRAPLRLLGWLDYIRNRSFIIYEEEIPKMFEQFSTVACRGRVTP